MIYDLIIIGAGPGGFQAALEGAATGLKTALIEGGPMGGTCLNNGCIPTKVLLGATSVAHELEAQTKARVATGQVDIDYPALVKKKDRLVGATRKAMSKRIQETGCSLFHGTAELAGPGKILVRTEGDEAMLEYSNLVVATGCRPSFFPGMEPDHVDVLDSTSFLDLSAMPSSLAVVGAGFIGLELSQAAHRLGSSITLVDALDRVAPLEDPEVSATLRAIFKRMKWDIRLSVRVKSLRSTGGGIVLELEDGQTFEAEKGLVAVGRRPNTENLSLESASIKTSGPGFIVTDDSLRASESIYAVGDVNGRIQLAHAASHQAGYVIRRITGKTDAPYTPGPIPSILYGAPEVCRVGLMAEEAKKEGGEISVTRQPLAANPIAQAHAATQGFVKVVWQNGRVCGITAVGHDVSRLTVAASMIVQEGWTPEDARKVVFPHPTLDESLLEALLVAPEAI